MATESRSRSPCEPEGVHGGFLLPAVRGHHELYGRGGDRCLGSHGGPFAWCSRRCSMNRKANRACKEPGCVAYAAVGSAYCKAHGVIRMREYRSSEHKKEAARLYRTGQWQALRRQQLTMKPLCAECLRAGKYTLASEVDHVIPHRNDPQLFFDPANLQSLCRSCHSSKTAREDWTPEHRRRTGSRNDSESRWRAG